MSAKKAKPTVKTVDGKIFGTQFGQDTTTGKKRFREGLDIPIQRTFKQPYNLSKSVWNFVGHTEEDILNVVWGGIAQGRDGVKIAKDLEAYLAPNGGQRVLGRWGKLKPGTKEYAKRLGKAGVDYRALRLYRSEVYRNQREAVLKADEMNPATTGEFDWVLQPGREKWHCECEDLAAAGPYTKDTIPESHINCDCQVRPRLKDDDKFMQDLLDYADGNDSAGAREIAEWSEKYGLEDGVWTTDGGTSPKAPGLVLPAPQTVEERIIALEVARVELKDIPKEAKEEIYNSVNLVYNTIPETKGTIKSISVKNDLTQNIAQTYTMRGDIEVSGVWYGDVVNLKAHYEKLVKEGKFTKGTDWRAALTHEIGHVIHGLLAKRYGLTRNALCDEIQSKVLNKLNMTTDDISDNLSIYGRTNSREFIAEAFAEYMHSNTPRQIAIETVKLIIEYLRRKK
jgi:hypothetical protein